MLVCVVDEVSIFLIYILGRMMNIICIWWFLKLNYSKWFVLNVRKGLVKRFLIVYWNYIKC